MEIRWYARYVPDGPKEYGLVSSEDHIASMKMLEQLLASLAEFTDVAKLEDNGAIGAGFTADQAQAGHIADTTAALAQHGYSPAGAPRSACPDCGYLYPPGTSVGPLDGAVLDPIVESGGRSGHPDHCRDPKRRPACPRSGSRSSCRRAGRPRPSGDRPAGASSPGTEGD